MSGGDSRPKVESAVPASALESRLSSGIENGSIAVLSNDVNMKLSYTCIDTKT